MAVPVAKRLVTKASLARSKKDALVLPDFTSRSFTFTYNPQWDWCRGVALVLTGRNYQRLGDPKASKVFQSPESFMFLVKPEALVLPTVQPGEPLFCSLALYHVKEQVKISEVFYFSVIEDKMYADAVTTGLGADSLGDLLGQRACVFSVSVPSQYVHLVLTVRRVLQGDLEKMTMEQANTSGDEHPPNNKDDSFNNTAAKRTVKSTHPTDPRAHKMSTQHQSRRHWQGARQAGRLQGLHTRDLCATGGVSAALLLRGAAGVRCGRKV